MRLSLLGSLFRRRVDRIFSVSTDVVAVDPLDALESSRKTIHKKGECKRELDSPYPTAKLLVKERHHPL
jgi:hypothetical protein